MASSRRGRGGRRIGRGGRGGRSGRIAIKAPNPVVSSEALHAPPAAGSKRRIVYSLIIGTLLAAALLSSGMLGGTLGGSSGGGMVTGGGKTTRAGKLAKRLRTKKKKKKGMSSIEMTAHRANAVKARKAAAPAIDNMEDYDDDDDVKTRKAKKTKKLFGHLAAKKGGAAPEPAKPVVKVDISACKSVRGKSVCVIYFIAIMTELFTYFTSNYFFFQVPIVRKTCLKQLSNSVGITLDVLEDMGAIQLAMIVDAAASVPKHVAGTRHGTGSGLLSDSHDKTPPTEETLLGA